MKKDNMLITIARESLSADIPIRTYARRAEAYNSTLAKPFNDDELVRVYMAAYKLSRGRTKNDRVMRGFLREELARARTKREADRSRLWGRMARDINNEEG